jgi:hypothetical protein
VADSTTFSVTFPTICFTCALALSTTFIRSPRMSFGRGYPPPVGRNVMLAVRENAICDGNPAKSVINRNLGAARSAAE